MAAIYFDLGFRLAVSASVLVDLKSVSPTWSHFQLSTSTRILIVHDFYTGHHSKTVETSL